MLKTFLFPRVKLLLMICKIQFKYNRILTQFSLNQCTLSKLLQFNQLLPISKCHLFQDQLQQQVIRPTKMVLCLIKEWLDLHLLKPILLLNLACYIKLWVITQPSIINRHINSSNLTYSCLNQLTINKWLKVSHMLNLFLNFILPLLIKA